MGARRPSPRRSPGAACRRPGLTRPRWPATRGTAGTSSSPPRRASGKSLGYLLPALTGVLEGGTALYLAPTRALAADQLRVVSELAVPGVRAAVVDGDTPVAARDWARSHANYLLTTPDMLHQTLLPRHARWNGFFRRLRYIVVDECHTYRGVFGSHVAQVLRRLHRIAAHHGGRPPGRSSCSPRPRSASPPDARSC